MCFLRVFFAYSVICVCMWYVCCCVCMVCVFCVCCDFVCEWDVCV